MKICFLIQRLDKPSSRYRVLQYLPEIKNAGYEAQVFEVSGKFWQRLSILKKASRYPVVFIQKKLFHPLEIKILKSKGAKLIYDFDDAIMFRHKPVPGAFSKTRDRYFKETIKACSAVFAGNLFLKEQAEKYSDKVIYLPTTVNSKNQKIVSDWNKNGAVTLGWLGSASTLIYLQQILPALNRISNNFPKTRLKVVSSDFPKQAEIQLIKKLWNPDEEEKDLHSFDIGLAPLSNDSWCEGKCGLKLLQYMASGLPTVSSPIGGQRDMIRSGENGFTASSLDEWEKSLKELIENAEKRKQLGLAARKTVEETFSLEQGLTKLLKVFHELQI